MLNRDKICLWSYENIDILYSALYLNRYRLNSLSYLIKPLLRRSYEK